MFMNPALLMFIFKPGNAPMFKNSSLYTYD